MATAERASNDFNREMHQVYGADDAHQFYVASLGGGGNGVHYGIFENESSTVKKACDNATWRLLEFGKSNGIVIDNTTTMLDSGSGNGDTAHFLAHETPIAKFTCLNFCVRQNSENRKVIHKLGLEDRVDVVDGSFDALPEDWVKKFDIIFSQDSWLYSPDKVSMLKQAHRALKDGGHLVFSDIMSRKGADPKDVAVLAARLKIKYPCSLDEYKVSLKKAGFEFIAAEDHSDQFPTIYQHMLDSVTGENRKNMTKCSEEFLDRMADNLKDMLAIVNNRAAHSWEFVVAKKI